MDDRIQVLRRIGANGMKVAVFMTAADQGLARSQADLIADLEVEEENY